MFNWISDAGIEGLASFVFSIAIPVMLFRSLAIATLPDQIPWEFLLGYYGTTLGLFGLSFFGGRILRLTATESSVFAMNSVYSNAVLLGIPLVLASFGEQATIPLFIIISTHAAILFFITTFFAESGLVTKDQGNLAVTTLKVLLKNPIFVGIILGLVFNLSTLNLPHIVDKTAAYLGGAALPCAVFSIGATISRYRISGDAGNISLAVLVKNLLHPLLIWIVCTWILNLDQLWAGVAVLLAACPTGINAYLFATRYNVIVQSTATIVVLSTALSVPVISFVLFLFVT